jgi:ABC-type Fe3+ transport system permease subunit
MANEPQAVETKQEPVAAQALSGAVQVGLIAAASAVVGGLAVAWWHRKTLHKLHNAAQVASIPTHGDEDDFGI